jgi:nitroreductase
MTDAAFADDLLAFMKRRRVCRSFTPEPVADDDLRRITEAGRWASSAGNRHIHKFLIVRDPHTIRLVRAIAPGMIAIPPALIVILTDQEAAAREMVQLERDCANWGDVGTAAMMMLLMGHGLGLGMCPVTSFSQSGARAVLDLPETLTPEWLLLVGRPAPQPRGLAATAPKPVTARDLTWWERAGQHEPE